MFSICYNILLENVVLFVLANIACVGVWLLLILLAFPCIHVVVLLLPFDLPATLMFQEIIYI